VFQHTIKNNGGYLSQACSAADLLATMYNDILKLGEPTLPAVPKPFPGVPGPQNPDYFSGAGYHGAKAPENDRFIISPAHYALVIYSALIEAGRMDESALDHFNVDGRSLEMIGAEHSPGFEVMSGSLAQALSMAAGVAVARKRRGDTGRVWVMMSDGEFQEGQTWEAFAAMSHHGIDNLSAICDVNGQQVDGAMKDVLDIGDIAARVRAFGAHVEDVDGHDIAALRDACSVRVTGKPTIVLARTTPWQGMDYLQKKAPRIHYVRFQNDEDRRSLESAVAPQLGLAS
jgi:transketolase